jgi:hypothetical protein
MTACLDIKRVKIASTQNYTLAPTFTRAVNAAPKA